MFVATTIIINKDDSVRDPHTLTYADIAGVEPVAIFFEMDFLFLHFAADLSQDQQHSVRARLKGTATSDALRADVLAAAPNIQLILNSTGTLTTAQLSDAVRALAKAVFALGKLVLNRD